MYIKLLENFEKRIGENNLIIRLKMIFECLSIKFGVSKNDQVLKNLTFRIY